MDWSTSHVATLFKRARITWDICEEDASISTTHPHSSLHPFAADNHQGMHMCRYRHTAGSKWNLKAQWDTWRRTCTVSATLYTESHLSTFQVLKHKGREQLCCQKWICQTFTCIRLLWRLGSHIGLRLFCHWSYGKKASLKPSTSISDTLHNSKAALHQQLASRFKSVAVALPFPWSQLIDTGDPELTIWQGVYRLVKWILLWPSLCVCLAAICSTAATPRPFIQASVERGLFFVPNDAAFTSFQISFEQRFFFFFFTATFNLREQSADSLVHR